MHEKQNVINENMESDIVCRLVHQKFCCVLEEGTALETLWERARAQAEPCSLALVLQATALGLFSFCIQRKEASLIIIYRSGYFKLTFACLLAWNSWSRHCLELAVLFLLAGCCSRYVEGGAD